MRAWLAFSDATRGWSSGDVFCGSDAIGFAACTKGADDVAGGSIAVSIGAGKITLAVGSDLFAILN